MDNSPEDAAGGGGEAAENDDVEMADVDAPIENQNNEGGVAAAVVGGDGDNSNSNSGDAEGGLGDEAAGDGEQAENMRGVNGNSNDRDVQLYMNWAEEAALARKPIEEPLPEHLINVMGKVFNNDMLVENILDKVIQENDRPTIRSCRLVSKTWLISLAKLYRKQKKPQFLVNTNKDTALLNDLRVRPMFEQHTLLYEFIKPMTTNIRHEGFIPTFSLTLGPSYFRTNNYSDFINCLVQCGSSLVELYINFPKNCAMSLLLPPEINLPNLTTFGISFSTQSLLSHPFPVAYHHHHEYYPNYCTIHLVQNILNASKSLRNFHFLPCPSPMSPPDLENLYLPETLVSVHVDTPLRNFELFLRRPLPYLSEIRINATIVLYAEESVYELLSKLSPTLKTVWLNGPPATRRSLPIKLPRLEHVTKFYMFKPWEFEEHEPPTNFEEVFPKLETLVFANQTQYSFNVLMKGMRSTTVTSFCVCLTSYRPTQAGFMVHYHNQEDHAPRDNPIPAHLREEDRFRREMQLRIERMRELALRGRPPRNRGDDREPPQNQAVPPPLPIRRRPGGGIRDRGVDGPQGRAENMLAMQMRNRMEVQRQLAHYRELRDRYERYARANRYRDEQLPQPPNPIIPPNPNRVNGEELPPPGFPRRPVLEIRRIIPNPPPHIDIQGRNADVAHAQHDHGYAMARRNILGRDAAGIPEVRVVQVPPRAHHNPPFAQPHVIRIPADPLPEARARPFAFRAQENVNNMRDAIRHFVEDRRLRGSGILAGRPGPVRVERLIDRDDDGGNQNRRILRDRPVPPPMPFGPDSDDENDDDANRQVNQNQEAQVQANPPAAVAGPSRAGDAPPPTPPLPGEGGGNDNDGQVPVNVEGNEEIQVIREIPPVNQRDNDDNDNVDRDRERMMEDADDDFEIVFENRPVVQERRPDYQVIDLLTDSDSDDGWPHAPALRVPVRPQNIIDLVVPQAMANFNNNNNNEGAAAAAGPVAGPSNAPPLPPRVIPAVAAAAAVAAAPAPANGNGGDDPPPRAEAGQGQVHRIIDLPQLRADLNLEARRNAIRERFIQRARGERPRPGHPVARGEFRRRGEHHYIELWDIRNPLIPPPLPERPVTMTKDKMQSINLAFPNLSKLTIQVCGPETCGLRYIFEEMRSLQVLKIIVESSLWNIKWDSLFTGIPDDFCEAVKTNSEIWDDVYLNESPASIRNMTKLEELMLVETMKVDEREGNGPGPEERQISDVAFHFGFIKLKTLNRLTVTQGFSPSQGMYNRWYDEKGYKIKVKPRTRLDMSYYADQ